MKQYVLLLVLGLITPFGFAQTNTNYSHCDCVETTSASDEYQLKCGDVIIEQGKYQNGKRIVDWVTRSSGGTIIIKAHYTDGVLDGTYEQFHFKGKPKLTAHFQKGVPAGQWTYFNDKGKIIKVGSFSDGLPTGIWTIYDKNAKKVVAQYDFDNKAEKVSGREARYLNKGAIARDDASGEWMVLHFPNRNIKSQIEPLGGYLLAGDFFLDYMNIPSMFMNTYAHYEFIAKLKVSNGVVSVVDIIERSKTDRFDYSSPSFPFIVQTNAPNKVSNVQHSEESAKLLKDRLHEVISISGPWITNGYEGTFEIQLPFVLNDIQRF